MEWLEMRPARTRFLSGTAFGLVLGLALTPTFPAWGQPVAPPPSAGEAPLGASRPLKRESFAFGDPVLQEPSLLGDGPLLPVTVEHQGRLLVLTYGPKSSGGLMADSNPRREPRRFAIYRGERQIASGQFEYG